MVSPLFSSVIKSHSDIITKQSDIVKGFINQADAKITEAQHFIKEAYLVLEALRKCTIKEDILDNPQLKNAVLFASGLSQKAQGHLSTSDLDKIVESTIDKLGKRFKSEILFRYLLTAGDSLGGTMRNLAGSTAQILVVEDGRR